jgi:hypothetical protein
MERAVILEAELRTLQQGEMSLNDYRTKLKTLADSLCDLGLPVSEPSQVLNLLRGLNPKYRHLKPTIKAKFPHHTFASARSYLRLEELCEKHEAKEEAGQALYTSHQSASGSDSRGGDSGSGGTRNKPRQQKRGSGSTSGSTSNSSDGGNPGNRGGNNRGQTGGAPGSASVCVCGGGGQQNPWSSLGRGVQPMDRPCSDLAHELPRPGG